MAEKKKHKKGLVVSVILMVQMAAMILSGCDRGYAVITQDEAMQMMEERPGCLIVDVRRPDEFAAGHIRGAVNVPNEGIADEMPAELPDKDQVLLIYCRTGNRSKEASKKLSEMGYTNIYEFGGIDTWKGEIVTD